MQSVTWTQFILPATETYCRRLCVWVPGGTTGVDGFLTVNCIRHNGTSDGIKTYGVVRNGLKVTVWRVDVDDTGPPAIAKAKRMTATKTRPYVVTIGAVYRCSCRSRVTCKHSDSVMELIRQGII